MKILIFVSIVILVLSSANGRILSKCDLAHELLSHGFDRSSLPHWVCLVNAESSFDTTVIGGPNDDGSFDWGLFQINDRYWCIPGVAGHECNIDCNYLVNDDISDDIECVRMIYGIHGFSAWVGWNNQCQGELPSVDECF